MSTFKINLQISSSMKNACLIETRARYRTTQRGAAQTKPMARVMCHATCYRKRLLRSTRVMPARTARARPSARRTTLWCHSQSRSVSSGLVTASHSLSGVSWVLDCECTAANVCCMCLLIKQFINSFVSYYVTWRCPLPRMRLPGGLTWGEYVIALN